MGEDEVRTLAALRALRSESFEPILEQHNGTVIKRMGDGWLVEFGSAAEAVTGALQVQNDLSDHPFLKIRIGIHIGDVVHEDEDIYGDGVNIAARLQEKAPAGGIALSDFAYGSLDAKQQKNFEKQRATSFKNIERQITPYTWGGDIAQDNDVSGTNNRPIILVRPFSHKTTDPDIHSLAEGLTDAVIIALSRFSWFETLPRTVSFQGITPQDDVKLLRGSHNISYALVGNIRSSGNRVRITTELLDAISGASLWSASFDGVMDDPFELEDNISLAILGDITPRLMGAAAKRAHDKSDGTAWNLLLRGRNLAWRVTEPNLITAQELLTLAIEKSPDTGIAQSDLSWSYLFQCIYGWGKNPELAPKLAIEAADKAIAADNMDAYAYAAAAAAQCVNSTPQRAQSLARRAIEINPNLSSGHSMLSLAYFQQGEYENAIKEAKSAHQLSPRDPLRAIVMAIKGIVLLLLERHEEMIENAENIIQEFPDMPTGWRQMAAAYAETGRLTEAKKITEDHILRLLPGHTATQAGKQVPFGPNQVARQKWIESLIKAGLPES
jgi:adenylate cyclase